MTNRSDGGPAFPKPLDPYPNVQCITTQQDASSNGMSLRDWFAGQALIGLVINSDRNNADDATVAYQIADAMLIERESK